MGNTSQHGGSSERSGPPGQLSHPGPSTPSPRPEQLGRVYSPSELPDPGIMKTSDLLKLLGMLKLPELRRMSKKIKEPELLEISKLLEFSRLLEFSKQLKKLKEPELLELFKLLESSGRPTQPTTMTDAAAPGPSTSPLSKRSKRNFYILVRLDKKEEAAQSSSSSPPSPKSPKSSPPPPKSKLRRIKRVGKIIKHKVPPLARFIEFAEEKASHWAIGIQADSKDEKEEILLEIVRENPDKVCISDISPEEGYDDLYSDDESYKNVEKEGMRMRMSRGRREGFQEPNYSSFGGIFWTLEEKLKSSTKFTDNEIFYEAQRIWRRQTDYRLLNNNCHRFCLLLAIHIRAKQDSQLRIKAGEILKKQKSGR